MVRTKLLFETPELRKDFFDWFSNEGEQYFWDHQDLLGKPGPDVTYNWDTLDVILIDKESDDE